MTLTASTIPERFLTERLLLRRWRADDAKRLLPVLEANVEHLHWIPAHVAAPVPVDELAQRLAGFEADFDAGRSWRFGIFSLDRDDVFGEAGLFPRDANGRVEMVAADRLEIGYWLRADVTGLGYASEAARALLAFAATLLGMRHVEIRCDPANAPSAAVPKRLGFALTQDPTDESRDMVWIHRFNEPGN